MGTQTASSMETAIVFRTSIFDLGSRLAVECNTRTGLENLMKSEADWVRAERDSPVSPVFSETLVTAPQQTL